MELCNNKRTGQAKKGVVTDEGDSIEIAEENFTPYYQPLVPWVNKLRKAAIPNGGRWKREDKALYTRMKDILREAQTDPNVST
jgi:hypothetical protein